MWGAFPLRGSKCKGIKAVTFDELMVNTTQEERQACVHFLASYRARRTIEELSEPKTPAGKLLGVEIPPPCSCDAKGIDPLCWHHGVASQSQNQSEHKP
jgi:hypothetical protein